MDKPVSSGEASQGFSPDWPGIYAGQIGGVDCTLELKLDPQGKLHGYFSSGEERLEVQGVTPELGGGIRGLLRALGEPTAIAIFRASLEGEKLLLEMDVPDPDEPDFSGAEQVWLIRLEALPHVNAVALESGWGMGVVLLH
ncbi:hypothetical protein [Calidithermus timidus]|jgi:hypothetical protein|uniref:hypothetical protein n=1 Tax=Calidithermus timidus TaxID=307124 RepID=UPI0003A42CB6|nr:hypothetical protein [Calidithermus timidus]